MSRSNQKILQIHHVFVWPKDSAEPSPFQIRTMRQSDIDILRRWKNARREFFADQQVITSEQQKIWYTKFQKNPHQQMLVCTNGRAEPVACVGFRQNLAQDQKCQHFRRSERSQNITGELELFNLICGNENLEGKGFMRTFFHETTTALHREGFRTIYLCVLKSNDRATRWYERQGFQTYGSDSISHFLETSLPSSHQEARP